MACGEKTILQSMSRPSDEHHRSARRAPRQYHEWLRQETAKGAPRRVGSVQGPGRWNFVELPFGRPQHLASENEIRNL